MRWVWVLGLLGAGCINSPVENPTTGPIAGSETHWLGLCSDQIGCPDAAECICGVCTAVCPDDASCVRDERAGRCATPADVAQLCGRPVAPAVCVEDCSGDQDCSDGTRCADGACVPNQPVEQRSGGLRSQVYNTPSTPQVDYLFVIDNSGSMCEEQRDLSRAFAAVVGDMAAVDYRVAVVSTDMERPDAGQFLREPAPPVPALNCVGAGGEPLAPDTADCEGLDLQRILSSEQGLSEAELAQHFRCLTTLGTSGDGFEKGLESMRVALSCTGPNAQSFGVCCVDGEFVGGAGCTPEFLRPDAELVVVFVTDENDCSDPVANSPASRRAICKYGPIDGDDDGVPDGYEDERICGDRSPAECFADECGLFETAGECLARCEISRSENSNCEWFRDQLTPVDDYADFLLGLKASPELITIASFVGGKLYTESGDVVVYTPGVPPRNECDPEDEAYNPDLPLDECCPDGRCVGRIQPSCSGALGIAFAGHRYSALAQRFPNRCDPESGCDLCDGQLDLTSPVLASANFCLLDPPRCAVEEGGGVRSCSAEEMQDPANHRLEFAVACDEVDGRPGCDPGSLERIYGDDEYSLQPDDSCPGGWVIRPDERVDHGARVRITYLPVR